MSRLALFGKLQAVPVIPPPQYVGIYFLFDGDEIVYVGQSTCIPQRVASHRARQWMTWDRALWMPLDVNELDAYEGALIRRLTPRYNTGAPSNADRDQEICDLLDLPPCDLARLAEFRGRRHESFVIPGAKRSIWAKERRKDRAQFERKHGPWISDPWIRSRKLRSRNLWAAVQPFLAEAKVS